MNLLIKEPTAILNGIAELIKQALPALIILGLVHLTSEQLAAINLLIGILVTFITTSVLRTQVANKETIQAALDAPSGTTLQQFQEQQKG